MKFKTSREALLRPLQVANGVVERRQAMPVLSNVLITAKPEGLGFTGTDLEVELSCEATAEVEELGEVTVPARKFLDIVRNLPEGSRLEGTTGDGSLQLRVGRSRFKLGTLPAEEFPLMEGEAGGVQLVIEEEVLGGLLGRTQFAMAQQDVRYYLNGMLVEVEGGRLRTVATDGHRLALSEAELPEAAATERTQVILPRKAVVELARILGREPGEDAVLRIGNQSMRAEVGGVGMTAKLVDGKFPEYEAVIPAPERCNRHVRVDGETLRQSLSRAAILSNEKYRAVRLVLESDRMQILAHNQEQEEAEEEVPIELEGEGLEIGFNVTYLVDVLGVLGPGGVRMDLGDSNASCLLRGAEDDGSRFVIMPMRL